MSSASLVHYRLVTVLKFKTDLVSWQKGDRQMQACPALTCRWLLGARCGWVTEFWGMAARSLLKAAPEVGGRHHLGKEARPPPWLRGSQCSVSLGDSI